MTRLPSPIGSRGGARGSLLRERRALVAEREQRVRDLGGVLLELFRRGERRDELLQTLCEEILAIEQRLHGIDTQVSGTGAADAPPTVRCVCGAPLAWDAERCEVCGWPSTSSDPVDDAT